MRPHLALAAAILSVLALLVGLWSAVRRQAGVTEPSGDPVSPATVGSGEPCAAPLAWRIARVDPRFGIGAAEAGAAVDAAAALWEAAAGRRLFVQDSSGGFPIRFTYDGRQAEGSERRAAESELRTSLDSLEARHVEVEALDSRYREDLDRYERDAMDLSSSLARHNDTVRAWSARDDAPAATLDALRAAGEALELRRLGLEARRNALEALGLELAAARKEHDERWRDQERRERAVRERFPRVEAEAARYSEVVRGGSKSGAPAEREIRVYRFDGTAGLVRVLAHELGHALGLGHADAEAAVMSERFELALGSAETSALHAADLELLRARCPHWFTPSPPGRVR